MATTKTGKKKSAVSGEILKNGSPRAVKKNGVVVRSKKTEDEKVERDSMLSIVGTITTTDLKKALDLQTEQRKLIKDFINEHLQIDRDYGKIHVVRGCMAEDKQRGSCNKDYHFSKPILFKPGQEKIFSLFSITDELIRDEETFNMLQNVPGLVAYKCVMYQRGKKIGEGRGAATLGSERSDPNSTIKKAEKRARMDACLSLGFSEYFTQDLDDPEYAAQREMANSKAAAEAERRDKDEFGLMPRDKDQPIDNNERAVLHRIMVQKGFTDQEDILELLRNNGIQDPTSMTSGQARDMMSKLTTGVFVKPEKPEEPAEPIYTSDESQDVDMNDILPAVIDEGDNGLTVDDDLKEYVRTTVEEIGLNNRGMMWFRRQCDAPPYFEWERFTDKQWRKAYDLVELWNRSELDIALEYYREGATIKPSKTLKNEEETA